MFYDGKPVWKLKRDERVVVRHKVAKSSRLVLPFRVLQRVLPFSLSGRPQCNLPTYLSTTRRLSSPPMCHISGLCNQSLQMTLRRKAKSRCPKASKLLNFLEMV
jgi:hypothetical protein